MKIFIGIDAGIKGGIAAIDEQGNIITCVQMPTEAKTPKGLRVNASELSELITGLCLKGDVVRVLIEKVHAMPNQGVSSCFNFGDAFGVIRGVIAAHSLPVQFTTPMKWKKGMGLIGQQKDYGRSVANHLYPEAGLRFKKDIDRAEALLMATYLKEEISAKSTI
jgi:crossover junction endodeoxyribonuclease RuvC